MGSGLLTKLIAFSRRCRVAIRQAATSRRSWAAGFFVLFAIPLLVDLLPNLIPKLFDKKELEEILTIVPRETIDPAIFWEFGESTEKVHLKAQHHYEFHNKASGGYYVTPIVLNCGVSHDIVLAGKIKSVKVLKSLEHGERETTRTIRRDFELYLPPNSVTFLSFEYDTQIFDRRLPKPGLVPFPVSKTPEAWKSYLAELSLGKGGWSYPCFIAFKTSTKDHELVFFSKLELIVGLPIEIPTIGGQAITKIVERGDTIEGFCPIMGCGVELLRPLCKGSPNPDKAFQAWCDGVGPMPARIPLKSLDRQRLMDLFGKSADVSRP